MSAQNNAAVLALQLEKVSNKIEALFNSDFGFFSKIQKSTKATKVSSRAMRLPIAVAPAGGISQVDLDSATGSFGRGSSTQYVAATFTPVYLSQTLELTQEAQIVTGSDEQAISNALKTGLKEVMQSWKGGIEALLQNDGSGTLGAVASISTNTITLAAGDNANNFKVQQKLQIFSALGGTNRGSAFVTAVDANLMTVTLDDAPDGTATGDLLVIAGGSGTAGSSLYGLPYLVNPAKSGTYLGLNRANYPLDSAHIAAAGDSFDFLKGKSLLSKIRMKIGVDKSKDIVWHMPLAQSEQLAGAVLEVSQIFQSAGKSAGDSTSDMMAANGVRTFNGRPVIESTNANTKRVDALSLDSWHRAESLSPRFHNVGGNTLFTSYGSDGGVGTTTMAIVYAGFQIANQNPLASGFIDGLDLPA